jgi:amyloid beta A4 precursor protein-binding family B member 2
MEEPQQVLPALYLGYCEVDKPNGMETLNLAIDLILSTQSLDGQSVNVTVMSNKIRVSTSTVRCMLEFYISSTSIIFTFAG